MGTLWHSARCGGLLPQARRRGATVALERDSGGSGNTHSSLCKIVEPKVHHVLQWSCDSHVTIMWGHVTYVTIMWWSCEVMWLLCDNHVMHAVSCEVMWWSYDETFDCITSAESTVAIYHCAVLAIVWFGHISANGIMLLNLSPCPPHSVPSLSHRHIWDGAVTQSRVVSQIDQQTEVYQYVTTSLPPLTNRDHCIYRSVPSVPPSAASMLLASRDSDKIS